MLSAWLSTTRVDVGPPYGVYIRPMLVTTVDEPVVQKPEPSTVVTVRNVFCELLPASVYRLELRVRVSTSAGRGAGQGARGREAAKERWIRTRVPGCRWEHNSTFVVARRRHSQPSARRIATPRDVTLLGQLLVSDTSLHGTTTMEPAEGAEQWDAGVAAEWAGLEW